MTETSATSESLFTDLKSIVLKHKTLPLRVDEFFKTHTTSIIGSNCTIKSKMMVTDLKSSKNNIYVKEHPTDEYYSDNNKNIVEEIENAVVENWRGLAEPAKKKKKG